MTRVDLHVHSEHSRHPGDWFLQRLGAQESYTPAETIYRLARQRGNRFVTLTDHNTIDGARELVRSHPEDCFLSVELTTYFPENGCKIHVLAYGISEAQFTVLQKARENIYLLRDVLRQEGIACSVAHATYAINGRLTMVELEKLLLLFDVFEVINGARGRLYNQDWFQALRALTPTDMDRLHKTYHIEPWGHEPWRKGFTGGSDDHAGLYAGGTYTVAQAASRDDFLEAVRNKSTLPGGRYGDHKALAFALYKVAGDLARQRGGQATGMVHQLLDLVFDEQRPGVRRRMAVRRIRRHRHPAQRLLGDFLHEMITRHDKGSPLSLDEQVERAYEAMTLLLDSLVDRAVESAEELGRLGDTWLWLQRTASSLPMVFMAIPFLSTLRLLHHERALVRGMRARLRRPEPSRPKKILWFSDTLRELNGVAVTMRELANCAARERRPFKLVVCLEDKEMRAATLPSTVLRLPCLRSYTPEFYTAFTFRLPSLLRSLDAIAAEEPDEIVLSTPGPLGLLGWLAARLLGVRCVAVYHTDITRQIEVFTGDAGVAALAESYSQWFYTHMDEVRVPTRAYMDLLARRGIRRDVMRLFRRGLDASYRTLDPERLEAIRQRWYSAPGPTLLWAGRMGGEKGLDFLCDVYERAARSVPGLRLILAGDGPERARLEARLAGFEEVYFMGRLSRDELRYHYALGDLFVFPSTTDTFGMVVLEALSLGLPALVSDQGGPQELVRVAEGGSVLPAGDCDAWTQAVSAFCRRRLSTPEEYSHERLRIQECIGSDYAWSAVLDDMQGAVAPRMEDPDSSPNGRAGSEITGAPALVTLTES